MVLFPRRMEAGPAATAGLVRLGGDAASLPRPAISRRGGSGLCSLSASGCKIAAQEILDAEDYTATAAVGSVVAVVVCLADTVISNSRRQGERGNRRHAMQAERESVSS